MNNGNLPRFYFALPRLLVMFRGGDIRRAENQGVEAWSANIAIYLISYFFFAEFVPLSLAFWLRVPIFAALLFAVWLFWLLALYVNSLVIGALRFCGLFRAIPIRHAQSILIGTTATAMSLHLVQRGGAAKELAAIWLVAVAMNLVAAAILALRNGSRAQS